jgi:hypothetical protein
MKFGLRSLTRLALAGATLVSLSACETPQQTNAAVGGVMGGATGAVVGSAVSGGSPGAALAGGVIGAATGAMLGAAATPPGPGYYPPPHSCASWYYDYYGNRVCRGYY